MACFVHAGIALAAKPILPATKLWLLIVLSFGLDILSRPFLILGQASHNPFVAALISVIVTFVVYLKTRIPFKSSMIGLIVFSHWILDFITWPITAIIPNPPRMHLFPSGNSMEIGLGLYSTMAGAVTGESVSFLVGLAIYIFLWRKRRLQAIKGRSVIV